MRKAEIIQTGIRKEACAEEFKRLILSLRKTARYSSQWNWGRKEEEKICEKLITGGRKINSVLNDEYYTFRGTYVFPMEDIQ